MARKHILLKPEFEVHYHFKDLNDYIDEATVCIVEKDGKLFHGMSLTNFKDSWNRKEGNNRARGRAYFAAQFRKCPEGGCVEHFQGMSTDGLPPDMKERKNRLLLIAKALASLKASEVEARYEYKEREKLLKDRRSARR